MEYVNLGKICEIINGYNFKSSNYVSDGVRVIRITNVQQGYLEDKEPVYYSYSDEIKKYMLEENDLLMSLTGNVGRVGLLNKSFLPAGLNQRVACIRNVNSSFSTKFLFYYFNNELFRNKAILNSNGVAQLNLSTEWLKKIKIPCFDKKMQDQITEKFDKLTSLIEKNKNLINYLNNIVKSQFIEMFGTINMNQISNSWESIDKYCKIYTGTTPSSSDESNWNGDIPWVTPSEINTDSFYIYSTIRKISEKGRKSKSLDIMPVNTVLLSTRAPIGKVAIAGVPMTCNQGFKNFVCCEKLNHIFLYVLLKNNKNYLNSLGSGTTFLEISRTKISKIKIPIPPIELQNKYASFVEQIDKSKYFGGAEYGIC